MTGKDKNELIEKYNSLIKEVDTLTSYIIKKNTDPKDDYFLTLLTGHLSVLSTMLSSEIVKIVNRKHNIKPDKKSSVAPVEG